MIKKVTITGADDSIKPADLYNLSLKYPFVEWGILVSRNNHGVPRFPSEKWINELKELKIEANESDSFLGDFNLSCHVCGRAVKEIFQGEGSFLQTFPVDIFGRMQLNTHGQKHEATTEGFKMLATLSQEIIFQNDEKNTHLLDLAKEYKVHHSALFDLSHGVGKLPSEWPDLLANVKCGYAGGLSPDNLEEQILKIEEKVGNTEIWIDMETHVRSNSDAQFDLEKVERCLQICKSHIDKKERFMPDEELLGIAETFSQNWGRVGTGDYISPGDKKYHIKYVDKITTDGQEISTANIVIEYPSGMIIISKDKLHKYSTNEDYLFFMILWCIVHREVRDNSKADLLTMEYYLTTGRLPKNVVNGYMSVYGAGDNEITRERVQGLIDYVNANKK